MTTTAAGSVSEIEMLRQQAHMAHQVVRLNFDGLTHEDSLMQPSPAGNCPNWVLGHLLAIYGNTLRLLGQEPVLPQDLLKRYDRGSPPITHAADAIALPHLMTAWDESFKRVDAALAALTTDALDQPAPFSPSDNPNETMRSLLTTIAWHQAYHAGQTGILRRIAGKQGAIG